MSQITVDLDEYRTPGAKVFTGRDRGLEVRKKSRIDDLELKFRQISIRVPIDIFSINPSFLEEFLQNVVTKLGKEEFLKRFIFENEGEYKIKSDLDSAIDRILRKRNALI